MELTHELKEKGFQLCDVNQQDLQDFIDVKRACYKKYVDEFYGGWVEEDQVNRNINAFYETLKLTCFKKIILGERTVGFLTYDEEADKISGISIQMIETARNKGIGSFYLSHVTSLADKLGKPVFLKVFITNPAQNLYKRFGFEAYDKTESHYLMRYEPKAAANAMKAVGKFEKIDFGKITACGECCVGCRKKDDGLCEGCLETDGHCKEWAQSGQCVVHKCAKEHGVRFCGLCGHFPCDDLPKKIHWNPNVVEHLSELASAYRSKEYQ